MRIAKLFSIFFVAAVFCIQNACAVTSDELALFLGVSSWHAPIDLPPDSFTIQICTFSNGKVDEPLLSSEPMWTKTPEDGVTIIIGSQDGKYRVVVKFPGGSSLGTMSQVPLFDYTISSSLPPKIKEGDFILFGKQVDAASKYGSNDLRSFSQGFLVRIKKKP